MVGRKGGFLTATVSDLPMQPKSRLYQQKFFFWLLQRQDFGFYYSAVLAFTIQILAAFTIQKGIPCILIIGRKGSVSRLQFFNFFFLSFIVIVYLLSFNFSFLVFFF